MKPAALLLAGALAAAPVAAGVELHMTDDAKAICDAGGGCVVATREWLRNRLAEALEAGKSACRAAT